MMPVTRRDAAIAAVEPEIAAVYAGLRIRPGYQPLVAMCEIQDARDALRAGVIGPYAALEATRTAFRDAAEVTS